MKKFTFVDHINPGVKKEVVGYGYSMNPGGHYEVKVSCFKTEVINCRHFYLAKVEVL